MRASFRVTGIVKWRSEPFRLKIGWGFETRVTSIFPGPFTSLTSPAFLNRATVPSSNPFSITIERVRFSRMVGFPLHLGQ